jgi:hypothetical protein
LIFDKPTSPAKLIGVEYMITKRLYEGLSPEERKSWHRHDYEVRLILLFLDMGVYRPITDQVRSGMLIMLNPTVPNAVWGVAETAEMREVVGLYGKTYRM